MEGLQLSIQMYDKCSADSDDADRDTINQSLIWVGLYLAHRNELIQTIRDSRWPEFRVLITLPTTVSTTQGGRGGNKTEGTRVATVFSTSAA